MPLTCHEDECIMHYHALIQKMHKHKCSLGWAADSGATHQDDSGDAKKASEKLQFTGERSENLTRAMIIGRC